MTGDLIQIIGEKKPNVRKETCTLMNLSFFSGLWGSGIMCSLCSLHIQGKTRLSVLVNEGNASNLSSDR